MDKDIIINKILEHISNICNNEDIMTYIKKIIDINYDYITDYSDNSIRAYRYSEILEININNNYFTVYTTEWGTTSRRKVTFIKNKDTIILSVDNNEINKSGYVKKNYIYKYENELLKYYKYTKSNKVDYNDNSKILNNINHEIVDFYYLKDGIGIKRVFKDNKSNYSLVNIKNIDFNSLELFVSLYFRNIEDITYEDYNNKIKLLK